MALMKRRFLFEADDDADAGGDTGSEPTVSSTDDNADTSDDTSTDDTSDDNTDDTSDDNTNDENQDDNNDDSDDTDDDYSIDAEPDENPDDDTGGDDSSDDTSSDDDMSSDSDNEDKELDRNMFDSLSDDEKKRKINTLKKNFVELYGKCDALIEKFNQIENEEDDNMNSIIKRILSLLYDMKEYLSYYTIQVYDNNSYIENDITFNRYLSVLNGIKQATIELEKQHNRDQNGNK